MRPVAHAEPERLAPAEGDHGNDPDGRAPTSNTSPRYGHLRDRTLTMPSRLLLTFILLVCGHRAAAQTPSPGPLEVIRLADGSSLVGRVTSTDDGKIHMFVVGLGEVVIDPADVASRSPAPPPPPAPSPWSGTATGSMTHISTAVPGVAGSTLGAQLTLGVARTGPRGTVTLDGTLSYWRVDPAAADVDQWAVTLGGRWMLTPRWALMGRSQFEVNHVQYLRYRSTTIAGLGYFVLKSGRVSFLLAPGIGYGQSEQTELGRVLSFAAGIPPGVDGPITGLHDMVTLQLTPMLSFHQDMHYFWSLGDTPFRQAQFNAKLLGMMTSHFGLSIAFKEVYDSSMPPPVERRLRSLVSGVQLKF
jgi:putative salt-induced outer membrane protein YdiY